MKFGFVYLRPLNVVYVRAMGPYALSSKSAWSRMYEWISGNDYTLSVCAGYGLLLDDPRVVPREQCRYEACIELTDSMRAALPEGFAVRRLPGGAYARHRHRGGAKGLSRVISEFRDSRVPAQGIVLDPRRPVIEVYFDNPYVVPEEQQRVDICLPVVADEDFGQSAA